MTNIITDNRLRILAFGINTATQTEILYHRKGADLMARKLEDNHAIMTNVAALRTGRSELQNHPINALAAELEALEAEYKALWDAVIAYANEPEPSNEKYATIVSLAIKSRFWDEWMRTQNAAGAGGVGE